MPPVLAAAAPIVAPMVVNIAGGLIQNLAGQALRNLPLIGDSFQKIAGGIGQIFGGTQQVMAGIGQLNQLLAPRGLFPPLPLPGLPGFPGGRPHGQPFGPRWRGVEISLPRLGQHLQRLLHPGNPFLKNLNRLMENLNRLMENLNRLLDRLGPGAPTPPGVSPGTPTPPGTSPGGGVSPPGVGGGGIDRLFDQMDSIMNRLNSGGDLSPKELMKLQLQMQRIQQMIQMVNEMHKAMHDMSMSIIRNIR